MPDYLLPEAIEKKRKPRVRNRTGRTAYPTNNYVTLITNNGRIFGFFVFDRGIE
jgi:hypothetical protein